MHSGLPLNYTIHFTDSRTDDDGNPIVPGKVPFVIRENTSDGPLSPTLNSPDSSATEIHTSIVLPGFGLFMYGERFNESVLHRLENFASNGTAPVAPTVGQVWYDYSRHQSYVWNSQKWVCLGVNDINIASKDEYNELVTKVNQVLLQDQTPLELLTINTVSDALWNQLIGYIRDIGLDDGRDVSNITNGGFTISGCDGGQFGMFTLIKRFEALELFIDELLDYNGYVLPGYVEDQDDYVFNIGDADYNGYVNLNYAYTQDDYVLDHPSTGGGSDYIDDNYFEDQASYV